MNKKQSIQILFVLLLFLIFYIYFNHIGFNIKTHNIISENQKNVLQTHNKVLKNPIWEEIANTNHFFKRTSAFYVIERSLLWLYFIRKNNEPPIELDIKIEIKIKSIENYYIHFKNATTKVYGRFGLYEWKSFSYKFDLLKYLKIDSYDQILNSDYIFHLYVSNSKNSTEETQYPIYVNLKYIRSRINHTKDGSIACSKCMWLKEKDYQNLFWWIELHKQAGYKKAIFCNNSIPNTKEFHDLFAKNKDFIEVGQFDYFPDFINFQNSSSHKYLNTYDQLGPAFPVDTDSFSMMNLNECYLNNTNKYKHVSVVDLDEVIIPFENNRLSTKLDNFNFVSQLNFEKDSSVQEKLSNLHTSCSYDLKNKLENYLDVLKNASVNFYFHMGFYLSEIEAKQIIDTIEVYFKSSTNNTEKHIIKIPDLEPQSEKHNSYNFTFIIKNQAEKDYALNLCKTYRNIIQSFKNLNEIFIKKNSRFHRFFYIGGLLSSFAAGKTFHNTDSSFDVSLHYPNADSDYPNQANLHWVGYEQGHVSHFRNLNEFHKSSQKEISITELILDLNYINCYYKPILEKNFKIFI